MTFDQLKNQVRLTAKQYADNSMATPQWATAPEAHRQAYSDQLHAAFFSGMTIALSALMRNDGALTPQIMWKATTEVGRELGFIDEQLNKSSESGQQGTTGIDPGSAEGTPPRPDRQ